MVHILILGVGNLQAEVIAYCKSRGWIVHGLSYKKEGFGLSLVDHFAQINITDKRSVLSYAKHHSIDLVYSMGSDIAAPTISYVSEKLGLPCDVDEKTAILLNNKRLFRNFLKKHRLSPVAYMTTSSIKGLRSWNTFPAMIKPVDSQGQRGTIKVANARELRKYFPFSLTQSREGNVIIEEYFEGNEYIINCFLVGGKIKYCLISDRILLENVFAIPDDAPRGIAFGHRIPASISALQAKDITRLITTVIKKLGVKNGNISFQIRIAPQGIRIIEGTPRICGDYIWRAWKYKYNIDIFQLTFDGLLTRKNRRTLKVPPLVEQYPNQLEVLYSHGKPGTLFSYPKKIKSRNVLDFGYFYHPGERIRPVNGFMEKVGYRIIKTHAQQ
ncbi:MAG: ATP-grasp domain-containing protein [bacterium]|nr:ATP-grasp domain-containing protein [bacterium]